MPAETASIEESTPVSAAIVANFPEDEPIFAAEVAEPLHEQHEHVAEAEVYEEVDGNIANVALEVVEAGNESHPVSETYSAREITLHETAVHEPRHESDFPPTQQIAHGAMEEQEIEDEEADLASYGEEPGDDAGSEDFEEETRAAGDLSITGIEEVSPELAAGGEPVANGEAIPEGVLEAEEREAEELELEEAQAEAEALLEAEAIGDGTVDASAEVRAPALKQGCCNGRSVVDQTVDMTVTLTEGRGTPWWTPLPQSREPSRAAD